MNYLPYTVVNANGAIVLKGVLPAPPEGVEVDLDELYGDLGDVKTEIAPDDTYWDGTAFVPLKDFDDYNTLSTVTFVTDHYEFSYGSGLPNPTRVLVTCDNISFISTGGEFELVTDGEMNIETEARGNYQIILRADGFAEKTLEVTVS